MNTNTATVTENAAKQTEEVKAKENTSLNADKKKTAEETVLEEIRNKYKEEDGKFYEVVTTIPVDDNTDKVFDFIFCKPGTASYDRYVKTSSISVSKAMKAFVLDNICKEQEEELKNGLEEYPALALNIADKLLAMLGYTKDTQVKKL